MVVLFGADIRQWRKKSDGGRIRIEIPFPSATKGRLNSLQCEKGGFNLLLSRARFFLFLLIRIITRNAREPIAIQHFAALPGENCIVG